MVSISTNQLVEYVRGLFSNAMPHLIFVFLAETDRVNGALHKEPFKFENTSVTKMILRRDGETVLSESQAMNFAAAELT